MSSRLLSIFGFPVELYEGGPVENDKVFFILKGEKITEQYSEINDEFYITEDIDSVVSSIVEGSVTINDIKVFPDIRVGLLYSWKVKSNEKCGRLWMFIIWIIRFRMTRISGKKSCRISVANFFSGQMRLKM
jgi:hypothetical protein